LLFNERETCTEFGCESTPLEGEVGSQGDVCCLDLVCTAISSCFVIIRINWKEKHVPVSTWSSLKLASLLRIVHSAKLNSMVWARERTIPTERPPLVGEATANFLRIEGVTWSAWLIPTAVFSVF
jgi:hypothetical protein